MGCCLFDCIGGIMLTIIRWGIVVANVLFFVSGVSLIVLGSMLLINVETLSEFFDKEAEIAAIILISAGSLTVVVTFLGCCGAFKKSPWMMFTYGGLLFGIVILQLAGGIAAFVNKDSFQGDVKVKMQDLMEVYFVNDDGNLTAKAAWDNLQTEFECCGIDSFRDWSTYRPEVGGVPDSCKCTAGTDDCVPLGNINIFDSGCYTRLEPALNILVDAIGGVGIGVAVIMLAVGVFSMCLGGAFKGRKRRGSNDS